MSLPGPGGGGEPAIGTDQIRTSASPVPAGQTKDKVLRDLVKDWQAETTAWNTVEHLRVMLCKTRLADDSFMSASPVFRETYGSGRLSHVASTLSLKVNAGHLNLDWFDILNSNWWEPTVDGNKAEQNVALALLKVLERACHVPESSPGEPSTWVWPDGAQFADPHDAFAHCGQHAAPANVTDLLIEWQLKTGATDVTAVATSTEGLEGLHITSPVTKRKDALP